MKKLVAVAFALAVAAITQGAANLSGSEPAAEACPVYEEPPSFDVSGPYDSNHGSVSLTQSVNRITGKYECCGGGTISGWVRNDTIHYTWAQEGSHGRGVWNVKGENLTGTWGWNESTTSGGEWNLNRHLQIATGSR